MGTNLKRPQQRCEKRQHYGSAGFASLRGREGFFQTSPTSLLRGRVHQQQKGALEAAACLTTLPGLGGTEVFATKKSVHNVKSPASKGPLTNEGDSSADEDTGEGDGGK